MIIRNGLIFRGKAGFVEDTLYIENGRFARTAGGTVVNAEGCYVIPGLVDIHFHGAVGKDLCDAEPATIAAIAEYERANGITSICPATMTLGVERLLQICRSAAAQNEHSPASSQSPVGARLMGLHLEGPFIAPEKRAPKIRHISFRHPSSFWISFWKNPAVWSS